MKDFIITSLQSWDIEIGSTIKNTASEISKKHRVLYVNPPIDIATRLRVALKKKELSSIINRQLEVIQGKSSPLRQVNENLWILDCPFTIHSVGQLPSLLFNTLNRQNGKKMGKWILKQAGALGFKNYIHLIDTDLFRSVHLKEYIRPAISIYYRRDYVIGFPYWRKHGPHCEESLVRQSDIVLANSSYFAEQLRPLNPNTHVLNTGVNLELYDAARHWDKPVDMQQLPSPIIGYTGAIIESRLDSELLYNIAQRLPEYNFIFVGPEDEHFKTHLLHQLNNVFFLGRKEVEELPQYIRHFDVCINPQILNPITDGNYPLKIDEYLAMGKPVVATSTHTMRDVFSAHTHLAISVDEWISALHKAVGEISNQNLADARIAFAHTHSWAHSVETIYKAIEEYISENKTSVK
jgi:teichuronic acid biosynthesis glycosyltransferase TuaH